MHNKKYILKMLENLKHVRKFRQNSINILIGANEQADDKEVQNKVKEVFKFLVKTGRVTAKEGEELITKYFPDVVGTKKIRSRTNRPKSKAVGPFHGVYNLESPVIIDYSRMNKDWLTKLSKANPQEKKELLKPIIEASDGIQT